MVADDLTGALDAAAGFARRLGPLRVGWRPEQADAVAVVSTDGRDRPEADAVARSRAVARWLAAGAPAFRKIDSQLRGHVAAELAAHLAVADAAGAPADRVIVAPAFPAQHRVTRGGIQWRRMAADREWEPAAAPIGDLLAAAGLAARSVAPGDLAASVAEGGVIVADAETDTDLAAVARAGLAAPGRTLWVGSAGLAGALAEALAPGDDTPAGTPPAGGRDSPAALPAPLLMMLGTARPLTLAQVAAVEAAHPGTRLRLTDGAPVPAALAERIAAGRPVLVTVDLPPGCDEAAAAPRIRRVLGTALDALTQAGARPGTLFVSGGQTLMAVAELTGTDHLVVDREVEPGVPCGRWAGGAADGVRLVAKSGGFGGEALLCRLIGMAGGDALF